MGEVEDYLEKENLHSSWIRNMFQMITMGIVLITFFREHKRLKKYILIPISIIILGIAIGVYSIYYTYYKTIDYEDVVTNKFYTWKYLSIITCVIFILVAMFIIKYFDP